MAKGSARRPRRPRRTQLPPELLERIAALDPDQQNLLGAINPIFKLAAEKAELQDIWSAKMRAGVEASKEELRLGEEKLGLEKEKVEFGKEVGQEKLGIKKRRAKTGEALARGRLKAGEVGLEAAEKKLKREGETFERGKKRSRIADLLSYGLNIPLSIYGGYKENVRAEEQSEFRRKILTSMKPSEQAALLGLGRLPN